jgi:hypothetical protein
MSFNAISILFPDIAEMWLGNLLFILFIYIFLFLNNRRYENSMIDTKRVFDLPTIAVDCILHRRHRWLIVTIKVFYKQKCTGSGNTHHKHDVSFVHRNFWS